MDVASNNMSNLNWQDIARQVQEHRDATIAEVRFTGIPRDLLSAREVEITESTTERLIEFLATGQLRSREVTAAFLRRAGIAQSLASDRVVVFRIHSDVMEDQLYHGTSSTTCSSARR